MRSNLLCLFFGVILTIACKQPAGNKVLVKKARVKEMESTPVNPVNKNENKDTLIINTKCAVRIGLDTNQLDKLRKKYGDDNFYTAADDNAYYSYIADSVLKAKDMPVVLNKKQKVLKFVRNNGAATLIKIDTLSQPSNYYFFDPGKAPYQPDITDIKAEYQRYFFN